MLNCRFGKKTKATHFKSLPGIFLPRTKKKLKTSRGRVPLFGVDLCPGTGGGTDAVVSAAGHVVAHSVRFGGAPAQVQVGACAPGVRLALKEISFVFFLLAVKIDTC